MRSEGSTISPTSNYCIWIWIRLLELGCARVFTSCTSMTVFNGSCQARLRGWNLLDSNEAHKTQQARPFARHDAMDTKRTRGPPIRTLIAAHDIFNKLDHEALIEHSDHEPAAGLSERRWTLRWPPELVRPLARPLRCAMQRPCCDTSSTFRVGDCWSVGL